MAGTNPGFDGAAFRAGIKLAQNMGAAPIASDRVIFYFDTQLVYNAPVDGDDLPFDPQATVQRVSRDPVRDVVCSVEYVAASPADTVFGQVTPSHIAVMLLDDEYVKVQGCSYIVMGGEKYNYQRTDPPSGLFDVGLFTIVFTAENDA